ncbi:nitrogen fixation protein NifQ [Psychromonas sp. PT13]|uniref:nitrogen fixation protein NifQ n=1 Tax=Psychromonas sp. PT13 TaxID=3439547 RepID=UPI003EBB6048
MEQGLHHHRIDDQTENSSKNLILPIHYSSLNLGFCKQIMRAQLSGLIVLPHGLGLDNQTYLALQKAINDQQIFNLEQAWHQQDSTFIRERAAFCGELFAMKADERYELINLLSQYQNQQDPSSQLMAVIIATASLTKFHLWESLGLKERKDLGSLINHNFPELFALNTDNMRWKRFFYRQLCEQGGDYICRAPSCQECQSYRECFVS